MKTLHCESMYGCRSVFALFVQIRLVNMHDMKAVLKLHAVSLTQD